MKTATKLRANIRFTEDEYAIIINDAAICGESIPKMIKNVYFSRAKVSRNFTIKDAGRVIAAVNRVGNNVNQIARHLNSFGGSAEAVRLLHEAVEQLSELKQFAVS